MTQHDEYLAMVERLATMAHKGQVDKIGAPYIEHPKAVVQRLRETGFTSSKVLATGWLHDVLEDTKITKEGLLLGGIHPDTVEAVVLLTRTTDVPPEEYYKRIRVNEIALSVKLADIWHNTRPERLHMLPEATQARLRKKYDYAVQVLLEQDF